MGRISGRSYNNLARLAAANNIPPLVRVACRSDAGCYPKGEQMAGREELGLPYVGARCTIDWARWSGRAETVEMWKNFDDKLAGKFQSRFARLAESGSLTVPQQFQKLEGRETEGEEGIWEIKASGKGRSGNWRAACFQRGSNWWVTHFFRTSHNSRAVGAARRRAAQARQEHIAAEGERT